MSNNQTLISNNKVLIVEDEPQIAALHKEYLEAAGFSAEIVADGDKVLKTLFTDETMQSVEFDLSILDIMLPGMDGIEICRKIRQHSDIPLIFVTARVEEIDRLQGLELGADDYICKPFSPREVVARVKNILKRSISNVTNQTGERIQANKDTLVVTVDGTALDLTPCEFYLLDFLLENKGKVLSRDRLLDVIHVDVRETTDRTIDSHIKNIRKKIAKHIPDDVVINSVYGVGYKLEI